MRLPELKSLTRDRGLRSYSRMRKAELVALLKKREEIEAKRKEYYEAHMKLETERLKGWVKWYEVKLDEIREASVDSRLRMLGKLYRISERNQHIGVTITSAGVINPVNYPVYPTELKIPEYDDNEENPFCDAPTASSLPADCKPYNQIDYFKQTIKAYEGQGENADKYVKKVKELIDKPMDEIELEQVRLAMAEVKCPRK